jgi:hypothetical protein
MFGASSYDNETIGLMTRAIAIAHDSAAAEGRAQEREMAQARLAKVIMALVHAGERDPELIAKMALERLTLTPNHA